MIVPWADIAVVAGLLGGIALVVVIALDDHPLLALLVFFLLVCLGMTIDANLP